MKMYFSVKSISKNLDDYDHIKLITEEDPLQVKKIFLISKENSCQIINFFDLAGKF